MPTLPPSRPDLRKKRLDTALGGMHWDKVAVAATENTEQTRELHMGDVRESWN